MQIYMSKKELINKLNDLGFIVEKSTEEVMESDVGCCYSIPHHIVKIYRKTTPDKVLVLDEEILYNRKKHNMEQTIHFTKELTDNVEDAMVQVMDGNGVRVSDQVLYRTIRGLTDADPINFCGFDRTAFSSETDRILSEVIREIGCLSMDNYMDIKYDGVDYSSPNRVVIFSMGDNMVDVEMFYVGKTWIVRRREGYLPVMNQYYFEIEPYSDDLCFLFTIEKFYNYLWSQECQGKLRTDYVKCVECGNEVFWRDLDIDIIKSIQMFFDRTCGCIDLTCRDSR